MALACVAMAVIASAAAGATFPVFGAGVQRMHTGVPAAEADFGTDASHIAVRGDGLLAFSLSREVWFVQQGRLTRMPSIPTFGEDVGGDTLDVVFAPDGSLLIASCSVLRTGNLVGLTPEIAPPTMPSAVWRVTPGGSPQRIAGQLRAVGFAGDGGPALAARFDCPVGVAVDAAGGILIADSDGRVRRITPDGGIATVAGTGRNVVSGDGGSATRASLAAPTAIAALPQGGFAVSNYGGDPDRETHPVRPAIRIVSPDGVISTRTSAGAADLEALADGSLLYTDPRGDPVVRRLFADGRSVVVANLPRDGIGLPTETPIVGDPFGADDDTYGVTAVAATPDGGMLASWASAMHYVAPQAPHLLAVALRPGTRVPRPGIEAHLALTTPAHVTLQVLRRGRQVAASAADLPAGDVVLPLGARLPPGEVLLRVRAISVDGQIATAQAWLLSGGVLPVEWARATVQFRLKLLTTYLGDPATTAHCGRVAASRVDCALRDRRRCAGVASVRLRADGSVSLRRFRGNRRCRLA